VEHEKRERELSRQLSEMTQHHEAGTQQITELNTQMKIVEDTRDTLKRDLAEAADNIRQSIRATKVYTYWRYVALVVVLTWRPALSLSSASVTALR